MTIQIFSFSELDTARQRPRACTNKIWHTNNAGSRLDPNQR